MFEAGVDGALKSFGVGDECPVAHAVDFFEGAGDGVGVGHLWDPLGVDKGADFDVGGAGLDEALDEFELLGDGQDDGFVLEAVAGADFEDVCVV